MGLRAGQRHFTILPALGFRMARSAGRLRSSVAPVWGTNGGSMWKSISVLAVVLLLGVIAFAASNSMTGYIVDEKCGAKGAHPGAEACAKKCIDGGEKPVFVNDADKSVVHLENPDAIKGHEGHHVSVTGTVKDGVLHIDKLAMADAGDQKH